MAFKIYPPIEYNGELIHVSYHPLFPHYRGIKNRCYNKKLPRYKDWGGRGIKMSDSWFNSFHQFVKDMGEKPSPKHSVERKDNDKDYSKENCYWATLKEQASNKSTNIKIKYKGKIYSLAQIAEMKKIPYHSFYHHYVTLEITNVTMLVNILRQKETRKLKSSELQKIRQAIHLSQKGKCPILKKEFPENEMVVDHLHKRHAKLLKFPGSGYVRGVIHRQANSFEGKLANSYIRLGMHKFDISLPEVLRNMAVYLEKKHYRYMHPSEKPKALKLSKKSIKQVTIAHRLTYPNKKPLKLPKPDKKGFTKMTKGLEKAFKEFNIEPKFLKR